MRIVSEITRSNEPDFERNFQPLEAAGGILKTISTLIAAVESAPQVPPLLFFAEMISV